MKYISVIITAVVFLYSCTQTQKPEPVKFQGETQGTYYSIIYYDKESRNFQSEIDSLLYKFDLSVSLWVPNSIISRVNNNDSAVVLDKYFIDNFNLSQEVSAATGGSFDCTVAPLVKAWGFGFDETRHVDRQIIDSIKAFVGFEKVSLAEGKIIKADPRMSIDFNAIAQGYSVEVLATFLESRGVENYLVDIGGEIKGKGIKSDGSSWMVGIEKPSAEMDSERTLKAILALKNKSVATSGNYRKFYEENGIRYSHTIDPKTGFPVQHSLLSVSVMAENTAIADAYATAFMVMGFERAREFVENQNNLDAFFIYSDESGNSQTYLTPGFRKALAQELE
jgi:thiamine biosynthesis lipoprotein